jgi:hypothetical protein
MEQLCRDRGAIAEEHCERFMFERWHDRNFIDATPFERIRKAQL